MAASLRRGLCVSGQYEAGLATKERVAIASPDVLSWKRDFKQGRLVNLRGESVSEGHSRYSIHEQNSNCMQESLRWWENSMKANMKEIRSAQELVDSLLYAEDKLVIVEFYSHSCGGCRTLRPKICQLANSNKNALFLKVNYDELKLVCHSLGIHVLPFFRFYRGSQGRVCSFSCTNATINKFKNALAKHGMERCSLGTAKGLEESELLRLASNW